MRATLMSLLMAVALSACGGCAGPVSGVPEHTHHRAELGLSCAETCAPGKCASAYGIAEQAPIKCDQEAERYALCICQAP